MKTVLSNYMAKIGRRGGLSKSKTRARDGSIPVVEVESVISGYFKMIGRKGGLARSKAKAEAVRANGKLGGRPRKVVAI
jgi:hypothetical protein